LPRFPPDSRAVSPSLLNAPFRFPPLHGKPRCSYSLFPTVSPPLSFPGSASASRGLKGLRAMRLLPLCYVSLVPPPPPPTKMTIGSKATPLEGLVVPPPDPDGSPSPLLSFSAHLASVKLRTFLYEKPNRFPSS